MIKNKRNWVEIFTLIWLWREIQLLKEWNFLKQDQKKEKCEKWLRNGGVLTIHPNRQTDGKK